MTLSRRTMLGTGLVALAGKRVLAKAPQTPDPIPAPAPVAGRLIRPSTVVASVVRGHYKTPFRFGALGPFRFSG